MLLEEGVCYDQCILLANYRRTNFNKMEMHCLLVSTIGKEKISDRSGVLEGKERGWHTLASLLVGGKLEEHSSVVNFLSDKIVERWFCGLAISFLLILERCVCSPVKKKETSLIVCRLV